MQEIWKEIPSLAGYEASSNGRIRTRGRILAQHIHRSTRGEYLRVQVWIDGKRKNRRVNRLVCEAFYGPAPFDGAHARHLNGEALHNESANLAWSTASENFHDQIVQGTANLPPNVEELPDWHHQWPKTEGTNLRRLKFKNKLKMLARKKRGSTKLP